MRGPDTGAGGFGLAPVNDNPKGGGDAIGRRPRLRGIIRAAGIAYGHNRRAGAIPPAHRRRRRRPGGRRPPTALPAGSVPAALR